MTAHQRKLRKLARRLLNVLDHRTLRVNNDERDLLIESLECTRDNAYDNWRDSDGEDARNCKERYTKCVDMLARIGVVTTEDDDMWEDR